MRLTYFSSEARRDRGFSRRQKEKYSKRRREDGEAPKMTDIPEGQQGKAQDRNICTCLGQKQQIKDKQCQLCQQEIDTINLNGLIGIETN